MIIPTVAQTEAGYWLDVEPVELACLGDSSTISRAIKSVVARSGMIVPTPSRQNFPKPVVLAYSKTKSLSAFEQRYEQISLGYSLDGRYSIERYKRAPEGSGWVVDPDKSATFSPANDLDDVILRLIHILESTDLR